MTRRRLNKAKGKKVLTDKQAKAVKSIAKKVTLQEEETKFFQGSGISYPLIADLTSVNLFATNVNQGTNDNRFLGDSVTWRGLKVKYQLTNFYGAVPGWKDGPFSVVIMLIATKKYTTSSTGLTLSDIRDDTSNLLSTYFLNNQTKVLFKRKISVNQLKAGEKRLISGDFWVRRNQKIHFKDFSASYELRDMNYYLVWYGFDEANVAVSTGVGQMQYAYKNYFKDS